MPAKTQQTPPPKDVQRRALTLDVDVYQHMLDAPDLSIAQKTEMIEALWLLIVNFVDLGFEIQPEQSCGKHPKNATTPDSDKETVLDCTQSRTTDTFVLAANANAPDKEAS